MDDIHSKVDRLIQNNDVNDGHRLKRWHLFLLFIVMASLGSAIAIPFFQRKDTPFDAQEYLVDELNKSKQDLGANPLNGSAYNYWYAPPGSFGINQTKNVNFTFWKAWLKKYFSYQLEARQNNESGWQNANELLNVSLLFNQTNNTCKVTLTLNTTGAPTSLYYRFTLVANRSVISHVNKSVNYQYTLNLSANATENYSLVYNYSDLVPYVQSGKITIKQGIWNNYFYQRIKTNKKIEVNKTVVIDPNFGLETAVGGWSPLNDNMQGSVFAPSSSGTVNNITAYIDVYSNSHNYRYAIYNNDTGALVGVTVEGSGTVSHTWVTLSASGSYSVTSGQDYYVCAWCNDTGEGGAGINRVDGGVLRYRSYDYDGNSGVYPDPHGSLINEDRNCSIYVSYTASGAEEAWQQTFTNNFSYSNTTIDRQVFTNNFSYSNSASLHQAFTNNFSYSNSATLHQAFTNNFSYSNTTMDRQVFTNNFSYSNTSDLNWQQTFTNNFSYSNTSEVWHQEFTNNFSYSNTAEIWQQVFTNNFSYSNTSEIWNQIFTNDFSYSNDSVAIAWQQQFTNNFSYSNSTPPLFTITNEYPTNQSNIYVTQPTVYFNLTHPSGYTMNYSLYIHNTTLIFSGNNVTNGTQVAASHLFYSANTTYVSYFWRIAANDGSDWVNETFTFQAVLQGNQIIDTGSPVALGIVGGILGAFIIVILFIKRRGKADEY